MIELRSGFLIVQDIAGQRHAVRQNALLCISEDAATERTIITLTGGRVVAIDDGFDEVVRAIRLT